MCLRLVHNVKVKDESVFPPPTGESASITHTHFQQGDSAVCRFAKALSMMSLAKRLCLSAPKNTRGCALRQFCLSQHSTTNMTIFFHRFTIAVTFSLPFALNLIYTFTLASHPDILSSISTRHLIVRPKISSSRWSSLDFTPKYFDSERLPSSD